MGAGVRRRSAALLLVVVAAAAAWLGLSPTATPAPRWASAATASIRPGSVMVTDGLQCTANFVFTRGGEVFLGYAAHCASTGGPTDTNGCTSGSLPLGTPVEIDGARHPGVLVYSSWLAMQRVRERDPNACASNDLGLVRIDPRDVPRVNPSMPHWGGPTGLLRGPIPSGAAVYSYGSSGLRQGIAALSPKSGSSLGTGDDGWSHSTYTVTPGVPGDSGSGMLDSSGRAAGVLSTVNVTPRPLSNDFGDLQHMLAYARVNGMGNTVLALGTEPFNPDQLPLG